MIANSAPVAWLVKRNENRASRNSPCLRDVKTAIRRELFTLFNVERYASEPSIVFLELQFFPARPAQKYVIDITRLLANEKRGFLFLLALGHFFRTYLQQKLRSWTFRNAYYGYQSCFCLVQLG